MKNNYTSSSSYKNNNPVRDTEKVNSRDLKGINKTLRKFPINNNSHSKCDKSIFSQYLTTGTCIVTHDTDNSYFLLNSH
jgi:hypothetical protein